MLTPTRRGARALADAFVAAAEGRAVLPPQMRPLGDLDEGEPPFEPGDLALDLPAAIEPLRRRFELTRLVADHWDLLDGRDADRRLGAGDGRRAGRASSTACRSRSWSRFEKLAGLVEADLADHWRVSRAVPGDGADASGPSGWRRWASSTSASAACGCCAAWPRPGPTIRRRACWSPPARPAPRRPPPPC